jgi:HPt (histidine-containing phosphotransfer) domain-containing protein
VRVAALAVIPCIALALLLWQLAAGRAAQGAETRNAAPMPPELPLADEVRRGKSRGWEQETAPLPLQLPTDWNNEDARQAYREMCRAFIRDQRGSAALLYQLTAREDWGELRATARALHEAALALNARSLAEAALSVQEAALASTPSAARRVEACISALAQVYKALELLLRDSAECARGANA